MTSDADISATDPGAGLIDLSHAMPLRQYLREIWVRRQFAVFVPMNDIRVQNMDTFMGALWHVLNPAMTIGVYYLIFEKLLEINRGIDNYLGFLVVGVLLFNLTQRIAIDAVKSIERDQGLIRSVQFPRAILPISVLVTHMIAFVPALGVLLLAVLATGEDVTARWLLLPFVLVLHTMINLGLALIFSRAGHAVRDLGQILTHLFRLLFYASGVLFSVDRFVDDEAIRSLFVINPFYSVITAARWVLIDGVSASRSVIWSMIAWAIVLPAAGFVFFVRGEQNYGS